MNNPHAVRKPKQVRDQMREVNKIEKAMREAGVVKRMGEPTAYVEAAGGAQGPMQVEEVTMEQANEAPEAPSEGVPAPSNQTAVLETTEPASAATDSPEPTVQTPKDEAVEAAPTPSEDWEHKYRVLQGKYDAEVPRMARDLQQATRVIGDLQRQMAEIQEAPVVQPEETVEAPASSYLTAAEREEFGDDMVDFVGHVIKDNVGSELSKLARQFDQLNARFDKLDGLAQQVSRVQTQSTKQTIESALNSSVPEWLQLNEDPGFLGWLAQRDMASGRMRQELLNEAYAQGDANRVIHFFKTFQQENEAPPAQQPAPQPPAPRQPAVQLETLATPTPAAGAVTPAPASEQPGTNKRTWTVAEHQAFNSAVRRGEFKGREAEQRAIEEDILLASAEGRYLSR